jgi:hypothetical protein
MQLWTLDSGPSQRHRCELQTKIAVGLYQQNVGYVGTHPNAKKFNLDRICGLYREDGLSSLYKVAIRSQSTRSIQARSGPGRTDTCPGVAVPASGTNPPQSQTKRVECD